VGIATSSPPRLVDVVVDELSGTNVLVEDSAVVDVRSEARGEAVPPGFGAPAFDAAWTSTPPSFAMPHAEQKVRRATAKQLAKGRIRTSLPLRPQGPDHDRPHSRCSAPSAPYFTFAQPAFALH